MSRMRRAVSSSSFASSQWMKGTQEYIEWGTVKRIVKKQLAKAVSECKTQAANAKQLVGDLKSRRLPSGHDLRNHAGAGYDYEDDFSDIDDDTDFETEDEEEDISVPVGMMPSDKGSTSPDYDCRHSPSDPKDDVSSLGSDASSYASASSNGLLAGGVVVKRPPLPRPAIPTKPAALRSRRSSTARPTSQPPPPPIPSQPPPAAAPSECSEDYEVPICHETYSETSSNLYDEQSTYEQIEHLEQTYEEVREGKIKTPQSISNTPLTTASGQSLKGHTTMNSLDLDPSSSSDEDEILCDYWNRKVMSRKLQHVTQGEETDYSADVESVTTFGSTRSVFVPATDILRDSNSTPSAVVYDVPTNGKQGVARLHVISAEIPRSSKLRNTLYQNNNKPLGTSLSDASGPASSSDEDSIEVPTWGWMLLKKKLRSLCRLTPTNTENTAAASSNQSLTDGFPKPPLLPRQNSNPLGLLPAPPRPKALKPSKTSPSPLLHRATPCSEKSYDSVSLSSLVNRPLPPVPTTEDVYADVNFHEEPQPHELSVYPWFHDVEREDVEKMLREIGEQGCFLVRVSRRGGASKPYTLSLLHDSRIFHLHIRKRPEGTYALGSEKPKEKVFENVSDLIEFHRQEEILLTSRNQSAGSTRLTETHHV